MLDIKKLDMVCLLLSCNVAFNIAKETITASLMEALANMYEKSSSMNKIHLMSCLFNLRMIEYASTVERLNYVKRYDNAFIILLLYVDDMLIASSWHADYLE